MRSSCSVRFRSVAVAVAIAVEVSKGGALGAGSWELGSGIWNLDVAWGESWGCCVRLFSLEDEPEREPRSNTEDRIPNTACRERKLRRRSD